jgi:hypothetical protein
VLVDADAAKDESKQGHADGGQMMFGSLVGIGVDSGCGPNRTVRQPHR